MAENNQPSLADIFAVIPKLSDADVVQMREAVMAECRKRNLPILHFTETDRTIPSPRRPR